jgi:uncharacterized lipoprotein YbaY
MSSQQRLIAGLLSLLWLAVFCGDMIHPNLARAQAPPRDRDRDRDTDFDFSDARDRDEAPELEGAERGFDPRRLRPRPERGRWTLGITATDTDTGVRVTRVIPRSAADRSGIERGDVIITVNGYQVGRVLGRLYDLPSELERRADRRGRVQLLVQNRRNGDLVNLDVRLDPGSGSGGRPEVEPDQPDSPSEFVTITGRAMTRPLGAPLPFDASLTVQMFVLGGRGQPGELISQNVVPRPGTTPIPFALRFDPSRVGPGQEAGIVAQITVGDQVLYETRGPQRIGRPGSGPADIMLRLR